MVVSRLVGPGPGWPVGPCALFVGRWSLSGVVILGDGPVARGGRVGLDASYVLGGGALAGSGPKGMGNWGSYVIGGCALRGGALAMGA